MSDKRFDKAVNDITKQLEKLVRPEGDLAREAWLHTQYNNHYESHLEFNGRIWLTASILIPSSFAFFGVLAAIECVSRYQIALLGLFSIILLLAWNFFAENLRAIAEMDRAWIVAIEKHIGITEENVKNRGKISTSFLVGTNFIKYGRWVLLGVVVFAWIIIFCVWPDCTHLQHCPDISPNTIPY